MASPLPATWAEALARIARHTPPAVLSTIRTITLGDAAGLRVYSRGRHGYVAREYACPLPALPDDALDPPPTRCACGRAVGRHGRCWTCAARTAASDSPSLPAEELCGCGRPATLGGRCRACWRREAHDNARRSR